MLYYFSLKVILLFAESYITFSPFLYYFAPSPLAVSSLPLISGLRPRRVGAELRSAWGRRQLRTFGVLRALCPLADEAGAVAADRLLEAEVERVGDEGMAYGDLGQLRQLLGEVAEVLQAEVMPSV